MRDPQIIAQTRTHGAYDIRRHAFVGFSYDNSFHYRLLMSDAPCSEFTQVTGTLLRQRLAERLLLRIEGPFVPCRSVIVPAISPATTSNYLLTLLNLDTGSQKKHKI
jgi:hypothetical protein